MRLKQKKKSKFHLRSVLIITVMQVTGMIPLRGGSGGATPKFVQRTQLIAQDYQVV